MRGAAPVAEMNCWQEVGVFGDGSCGELRTYAHCRACPAFQAAAARLLEAPLDDADLAEAASYLARKPLPAVADPLSALIFRVGASWLALPTAAVQEVIGARPIHSLPHRRNGAVLGLANVRGELLVCVALPFVIGLDVPVRNDFNQTADRMLVTRQDAARIVFPVADVAAVERFELQDAAPAPVRVARNAASFTKAVFDWKGNLVSLLDETLLLTAVNRSLALATAT
ncbi:MAG TPA: chemotaxis protein CheW [Rhodopila sp.]